MSTAPPEFLVAKLCFLLAAVMLFIKVAYWLKSTDRFERATLSVFIFGVAGWALIETLAWVSRKENDQNKPPPVAALPWIEITTLKGLTLPMNAGESITAEMHQKLKEHVLLVRNPNSVDLRHFSARLQLPEPIVPQSPTATHPLLKKPPGVAIQWRAEQLQFQVVGFTVDRLVESRPKAEWLLDIDVIPALKEIAIPFLTIVGSERFKGMGADLKETWYLDGEFQIDSPDGRKIRTVQMWIHLEKATRMMTSSPPQEKIANVLARSVSGP